MTTSTVLRALTVLTVVVAVTACGGSEAGGGGDEAATEAGGGESVSVAIDNSAFDPARTSVAAGGTVEWTNNDDLPHTVTFEDESVDSSENMNQGDTHSVTFEEAGEYPYHCHIHPSMEGTVVVE